MMVMEEVIAKKVQSSTRAQNAGNEQLQTMLGNVTFKSTMLKYCVTPNGKWLLVHAFINNLYSTNLS